METVEERIAHLEIRQALEDLNNNFCYYLDKGNITELVDLFCEDARYSHGDRVSCGRQEIRKLFQLRSSAGVRTSRHLQTGLRLSIESKVSAVGESVCTTFAADEPSPISPAIPHLVADFTDEYKYCPDGRWRIKKRHINRIFTAPDNKGPIGKT